MELMNWNPLADMNSLFGRGGWMRPLENGAGVDWRPAADISETETEYLIRADLPEVKREDIEVNVSDGMITLSGERKQEKRDDSEKMRRVEKFYGSFTRSFALPGNIDIDSITASQADGVLTVHLPKTESTKVSGKNIKVS